VPAPAIASVTSAIRSGPFARIASLTLAVHDQAGGDAVVEEGRAHGPRRSVQKTRHRAVEVGSHRRALIDALSELVVSGVGVAQAHHHPALAQAPDALPGALSLRSQGDESDGVGSEPPGENLRGGLVDRLDAMGARPLRRQEGPFEVEAERGGSHGISRLVESLERTRVDIGGRADESGQESSHPARREVSRQVAEGLGARAHFDAKGTVHLEVDEPGGDDGRLMNLRRQVPVGDSSLPKGLDHTPLHHHGAGHQAPVDGKTPSDRKLAVPLARSRLRRTCHRTAPRVQS
jgi:hypothetical protein